MPFFDPPLLTTSQFFGRYQGGEALVVGNGRSRLALDLCSLRRGKLLLACNGY